RYGAPACDSSCEARVTRAVPIPRPCSGSVTPRSQWSRRPGRASAQRPCPRRGPPAAGCLRSSRHYHGRSRQRSPSRGGSSTMTRAVRVPYTVEQDEDGVWCAHAQLRPGVGANGEGDTPEAAIEDLREALIGLIAEFGAPDELTLTLDVA